MTTISGESSAKAVVRLTILRALVIFIVVTSSSCRQERPPEAAGQALPPMTLGVGLEPMAALAIIAEAEGFFARQGIDVSARKYPSGKLAMDAMLSGELQMATVAETPVMFDSFKRRDFRVLAVIGTCDNEIKIVARKDRGLRQRSDLKGRRIAAQEASSMHFFLHMFLIKHGLTKKDVSIVYAPPDTLAQMLIDGQVDACSMREPFISQAAAVLGDNALIFEEPGLYVKYYAVVVAQRFLEEHPRSVSAVLRALADAEAFAKDQPQQATAVVARTIQMARPALDPLWPCVDLRLRLNQSLLVALEDQAHWAMDEGLVKAAAMPNYLQFMYLDAMLAVKPSAVNVIR